MSRIRCASLLLALLAAPAFAKDVCFKDNAGIGNHYVFQGMKVPAKGRTTPIAGLFINQSGGTAPIQGSLYRNKSDGKFQIGIFIHSSLPGSNDFAATWVGDAFTFAGTAKIDADGTYTPDAQSLVLTATSCKGIELP